MQPPFRPHLSGEAARAGLRVLLISGSTRAGSSNTLALRKLHELDHPEIGTKVFTGLTSLPAFVPGDQEPPTPVQDLLAELQRADAVVFSTPEYAGGLPGSLKNLLDWTVGGGQLYQKPVAWLDVANPGRGNAARQQLRTVLGYVGARIIEDACIHLALEQTADALPITPAEQRQLAALHSALEAGIHQERDRYAH